MNNTLRSRPTLKSRRNTGVSCSSVVPQRQTLHKIGVVFAPWVLVCVPGDSHAPLLGDSDSVCLEAEREMLLWHEGVTVQADSFRYQESAPNPPAAKLQEAWGPGWCRAPACCRWNTRIDPRSRSDVGTKWFRSAGISQGFRLQAISARRKVRYIVRNASTNTSDKMSYILLLPVFEGQRCDGPVQIRHFLLHRDP